MKVLLILAVLLITVRVSSQPNGTPQTNQKIADKKDQQPTATFEDNQYSTAHTEKSQKDSSKGYASPEWWLVVVGFLTFGIVCYQSVKTAESAEVAERSLILQFRPRLLIRSVVVIPGDLLTIEKDRRKPTSIEFTVTNIGGSVAHITKRVSKLEFFENHFLPPIPPYDDKMADNKELKVSPGQHHTFSVSIARSLEYGFVIMGTDDIVREVYFFGYLRFRDEVGLVRSIGFCRQYDPISKRFNVVNDPDYEYAD
jgi:hypothetical protein